MNRQTIIALGGFFCGTAVALGAFAAHGLKASVSAAMLNAFTTAADYQLAHGLALILCGVLWSPERGLKVSGLLMIIGVLLFSGSLYLMVLTDIRQFGMITPIGGTCLLLAWCFFIKAFI